MKKNNKFYWILTFSAYIYYILFGLAWLLISLFNAHFFNYIALVIIILFGAMAYFKNKWANLIVGIVTLFGSFLMLMQVMSTFNLLAKNNDFNNAAKIMLSMTVLSIFLSIILIFSFSKLFENEIN